MTVALRIWRFGVQEEEQLTCQRTISVTVRTENEQSSRDRSEKSSTPVVWDALPTETSGGALVTCRYQVSVFSLESAITRISTSRFL